MRPRNSFLGFLGRIYVCFDIINHCAKFLYLDTLFAPPPLVNYNDKNKNKQKLVNYNDKN